MRFNLKGVAKTHKRLASGKRVTYHYAWRGGPRLPGLPGSVEFMKAYHAAIAARDTEPAVAALKMPTVSSLIERFKAAPEFTSRAASTRREYERYLAMIAREFGELTLDCVDERRTRGKLKAWRDTMADRPRTADYAWSVLARLMSFGVDRGELERNPAENGGRLYKASRSEQLWSDDTLKRLFAVASPEITAAVTFALWTGQRQGDCLVAKWSQLEDCKIRVRQAKGGRYLTVPVGKPLGKIIDCLPRVEGGTILTNSRGKAWTSDGFRASFAKAMERAGIVDDLHFHDLRGTAVTRMAIAGCTVPQIAAVTGHSPNNVDAILAKHYLGGQAELAEQAIRSLDFSHRSGHMLQTEMQTASTPPGQRPWSERLSRSNQ